MTAADVECPLTELPASQCACRNHRGGEVAGVAEFDTTGPAIEARYPGRAECCERGIREGDQIVRLTDESGYVHHGRCPR